MTTRTCGCAGQGRHRNSCPDKLTIPATAPLGADVPTPVKATQTLWHGLPCMPDSELEEYGGDVAAHDSVGNRRPLARWNDSSPLGSVQPDLGPRGMLVHRAAPEQRFHFAFLDEDGGAHFRKTFMFMRRIGYMPVTLGDFYVHSSLRDYLVPEDATGRLTLGALKGGVTVVYAQPEADYRRAEARRHAQSDAIQKTAEERAAELQYGLNRDGFAGLTSSAIMEDDREAAQLFNR